MLGSTRDGSPNGHLWPGAYRLQNEADLSAGRKAVGKLGVQAMITGNSREGGFDV